MTTTGGADYKYTIVKDDTISTIVTALATQINAANNGAGDTNVYATPDLATGAVLLTSRSRGAAGNTITVYVTVTAASRSDHRADCRRGQRRHACRAAAMRPRSRPARSFRSSAPISRTTRHRPIPTQNPLPNKLGGTQVYFNGIPAPLVMVSPTKVNAQIPWELGDTTSINAYVR